MNLHRSISNCECVINQKFSYYGTIKYGNSTTLNQIGFIYSQKITVLQLTYLMSTLQQSIVVKYLGCTKTRNSPGNAISKKKDTNLKNLEENYIGY